MTLEKSRGKEVSMSACNQMSATARKITLIQKVRNRKGFLNESKTQAVTSVVHQTNNSSPLKHRPAQIPRYLNTYRLESKNCFSCDLVYGVLEDVVYNQCFGVPYDPEKCASKVQTMAGEIMRRVRKFEFDRAAGDDQTKDKMCLVSYFEPRKDNSATLCQEKFFDK